MTGGSFLQDNRPATFNERGVAVPFTSAMAVGVRLRVTESEPAAFVVPETGGGHGWTAVSFDDIVEVCELTLHDHLLVKALSAVASSSVSDTMASAGEVLEPATVRRVARNVAATGACGRTARHAARMAIERQQEDTLVAHFLLVLGLIAETGISGGEWEHLDPADPASRQWLSDIAAQLGDAMGVDGSTLDRELAGLAARLVPIGMPRGPGGARIAAALDALREFHESLSEHAESEAGEEGVVAGQIAAIAKLCFEQAELALGAARDRLTATRPLVAEWLARPVVVARALSRPEWLLDGWDGVCALWSEAEANGRDARRSVMPVLQRMTPILPREALIYAGVTAPEGAEIWHQGRWMSTVAGGAGDRGESARLDRVCRYEILRAHTA